MNPCGVCTCPVVSPALQLCLASSATSYLDTVLVFDLADYGGLNDGIDVW